MVAFDDYPGRGEFACNGYKYKWNNAKTTICAAVFPNTDKLEGKIDHLYHILTQKFAASGKVLEDAKEAKLFDIGNGKRVIVAYSKDVVAAIFCTAEIAQNFDYDAFSDYAERTYHTEESVSVGTPYDKERGYEADTAVIDTTIVDY